MNIKLTLRGGLIMKHAFFAALLAILLLLNTANAQDKKTFTVTNQSGYTLTAVSFSPHDANNWGQNLVAKNKTVLNTESIEFKQIMDPANCMYDIKFTSDEGNDYYMKNVNLCKSTTLTLVIPTRQR
jgi:hypothetical protein